MTTQRTAELSTASREELVALIGVQQAVIAQLQERVAALEKRLGSSGRRRAASRANAGTGVMPAGAAPCRPAR